MISSKNILITGVTGNLGKAVAQEFKNAGHKVYGVSHAAEPEAGTLNGFYKIDLSVPEATEVAVERILQELKQVDVLVSTVGGFAAGNVMNMKSEDVAAMFSLNLFSTVHFVMPVFRHMISKNGGRIFVVGAKAGLSAAARTGAVAYGLSKSAIFNLAESLNYEGEKFNVVTSVVVPSTIDTPQNRASMPGADFASWVSPQQIASLIYYHSSDEASILRQTVIKAYGKA